MAVVSWNDVKGLDLAKAKEACAFPVKREDLFSDENNLLSKYKMVSVKMPDSDEFIRLGEVDQKRPFIPYPEAMDWLNEQLQNVGSDYKLYRSVVEEKTKALFQQYLFKNEITSPDGHAIAPSVTLRASYKGWRPAMEIHMGTYRFVCSNGAIVNAGGTQSIRVNCHNWSDFNKQGISDKFRNALDNLQDVSKMYCDLDKVNLSEKYSDIFSAKGFSIALRKKVLAQLENEGKVLITKENDRKSEPLLKSVLLEESDLKIENIANAVQVVEDTSLWNVYNAFTNTVTSTSSQGARYITDSQCVNRVFQKALAA